MSYVKFNIEELLDLMLHRVDSVWTEDRGLQDVDEIYEEIDRRSDPSNQEVADLPEKIYRDLQKVKSRAYLLRHIALKLDKARKARRILSN